ncbi:MAG: DUF4960 domain-containing protein [Chitinophagales bacterium]
MKHIKFLLLLFITAFFTCVFYSCEKTTLPDTTLDINPNKELLITDFTIPGAQNVVIDNSKQTINISVACGTDLTSITPTFTVSSGSSVTPASATNVNLSTTVEYTLVSGNLFSTWKVEAEVLCVTGFLSHAATRGDISDDDEKAAANWFFSNFNADVARFISFDDIKANPTVLNDIKVLWWLLDGDPVNRAYWTPPMATDPDVLGAITNWYKAGGNLYLYQYGCQMIFLTGRMPTSTILGPAIGGGGAGSDNPDTWGLGVTPGGDRSQDMSGHPIFAGVPFEDNGTQKWIKLLSPGWREDRNYMMDRIADYYGEPFDQPVQRIYDEFTSEFDVVWLGSWDWQNDYRVAGMLEFLPNDEFQGRAIYNGVGGAEFNMNAAGVDGSTSELSPDGNNLYQSNLNRMARNTINYLIQN